MNLRRHPFVPTTACKVQPPSAGGTGDRVGGLSGHGVHGGSGDGVRGRSVWRRVRDLLWRFLTRLLDATDIG